MTELGRKAIAQGGEANSEKNWSVWPRLPPLPRVRVRLESPENRKKAPSPRRVAARVPWLAQAK